MILFAFIVHSGTIDVASSGFEERGITHGIIIKLST